MIASHHLERHATLMSSNPAPHTLWTCRATATRPRSGFHIFPASLAQPMVVNKHASYQPLLSPKLASTAAAVSNKPVCVLCYASIQGNGED